MQYIKKLQKEASFERSTFFKKITLYTIKNPLNTEFAFRGNRDN